MFKRLRIPVVKPALLEQLLLVALALGAATYGRALFNPMQEVVRKSLSLSDNQMAIIQGPGLAMPGVLIAIPLGLAADRYSRPRLLIIFAAAAVLANLLTAFATSFEMLLLARFFMGCATGIAPITISLIADLFPAHQRGRASMSVGFGQLLGISGAFALGGEMASRATAGDEWRISIAWLTVPLVAALIGAFRLREPAREQQGVKWPSIEGLLSELWHVRAKIIALTAAIVLIEIALTIALTWTVPALSRRYLMPFDAIGAATATALLVGGIVGPIAGGLLADWCHRTGGPKRTALFLAVLTILSAPTGLFPVMPTFTAAIIGFLLFESFGLALITIVMTLFTIVFPASVRGLCVGIMLTAASLVSLSLAPGMVSLLAEARGGAGQLGASMAIIAIAASVLAGICVFAGIRHLPATRLDDAA